MTIPTLEVRGAYLMDPETEDLIFGDELADGMVVLIEDSLVGRSGFSKDRDLESTRWCRITKLRRTPLQGAAGRLVRFIGEYGDGSKFSRTYNESYAWFVKVDSLGGAA